MSESLQILQPRDNKGLIICLCFTRIERRGSLLVFADLHVIPFRLKLFSCTAHALHDRRWVALPSRPWVKDGEPLRDVDSGKVKYQPIIGFDGANLLRRFSDAACAALDVYSPGWDR